MIFGKDRENVGDGRMGTRIRRIQRMKDGFFNGIVENDDARNQIEI